MAGHPTHAAENAALANVTKPGVLVIAHRGDSAIAPENTLPAFESALKARPDLVELDYHHSADGVPVVTHDSTLDRCTDAVKLWGGEKIKLASKTMFELEKLDAGSWFGSAFAGARLPTLVEALDVIQPGSMTLIERKAGDPASCIKLLTRKKLLDSVVVQAFDWDYLEGCHALAPNLVLGALGGKDVTAEKLDDVARTGAKVIGWDHKHVTPAVIQDIHKRGYKAWVYTVDEPARARELAAAGIDGIITNKPALIRETLAESQR